MGAPAASDGGAEPEVMLEIFEEVITARELIRRKVQAHFLVIGTGPDETKIRKLVRKLDISEHVTINMAGASGHLELNVYKPVMAYNLLQSVRLIGDACQSFNDNCAVGIEPMDRAIRSSSVVVGRVVSVEHEKLV